MEDLLEVLTVARCLGTGSAGQATNRRSSFCEAEKVKAAASVDRLFRLFAKKSQLIDASVTKNPTHCTNFVAEGLNRRSGFVRQHVRSPQQPSTWHKTGRMNTSRYYQPPRLRNSWIAALAGISPCDGELGLKATTGKATPCPHLKGQRQVSLVAVLPRGPRALRQLQST